METISPKCHQRGSRGTESSNGLKKFPSLNLNVVVVKVKIRIVGHVHTRSKSSLKTKLQLENCHFFGMVICQQVDRRRGIISNLHYALGVALFDKIEYGIQPEKAHLVAVTLQGSLPEVCDI